MKKKIVFGVLLLTCLFTLAGCGVLKKGIVKETRTINYLMDGYVKAYTQADLKAEKDIFPEFYLKANEKYVNQEALTKEMEDAKEVLGDHFTITYTIDKETKMTDEELAEFNKKITESIDGAIEAKECYVYEGTVILKGDKDSKTGTMNTIARCNYDGTWYIIKK